MSSDPRGAMSIGEYLVSTRSFAEYEAMFALTDDDLRGGVLDCPGGGASFTATACARGVDARAVDPAYAIPVDKLADRLDGELQRGAAWTAANPDRYRWDFYGDPAGHARVRAESARLFVADRTASPERYVPGSLPTLPFPDGAVDLVLSSHLLFTYADRLDADFHRAALLEMVRVSRREVRVFPLVDQAGRAQPELLDQLRTALAAAGVTAEVRGVDYEFQRGAAQLLRLSAVHG
jgi:methyltransferase family protein